MVKVKQRLMDIFNEFVGNHEWMSFDQVDMEISSGEHWNLA
jgi:hypothetical protein